MGGNKNSNLDNLSFHSDNPNLYNSCRMNGISTNMLTNTLNVTAVMLEREDSIHNYSIITHKNKHQNRHNKGHNSNNSNDNNMSIVPKLTEITELHNSHTNNNSNDNPKKKSKK